MTNKRPPMILARQPAPEAESPPEAPVVSQETQSPGTFDDASAAPVDVWLVAERVYRLMCEDLNLERVRRGWR